MAICPAISGIALIPPRLPAGQAMRRTKRYVSFLKISGALHLTLFDQPLGNEVLISLAGSTDMGPVHKKGVTNGDRNEKKCHRRGNRPGDQVD